jgi:hypothetical protein
MLTLPNAFMHNQFPTGLQQYFQIAQHHSEISSSMDNIPGKYVIVRPKFQALLCGTFFNIECFKTENISLLLEVFFTFLKECCGYISVCVFSNGRITGYLLIVSSH